MRIAVLGLNHGYTFAIEALKMKGLTLVAVAGNDQLAVNRSKELGVTLYQDYKQLIDENELDGVIITLPNHLHKEAVFYCADRGVHCLVEKPIADEIEQGEEMVSYCQEKQVKLLVGHHRRFSSQIKQLKTLLDEGIIGDLIGVNMMWVLAKDRPYFEAEWRINAGGGPLLINGIHDIDNLRYVTGLDIESVYAIGKNNIRGNKVEDSVSAVLEASNGATINYYLSDGIPSPWSYEFNLKENAKYHFYDEDCYYFFGTKGSLAFPSFRIFTYADDAYGWEHPLEKSNFSTMEKLDPIVAELTHFIKVLKGVEDPLVTGEEGVKTLEVLEAMRRSMVEKRRVELNERSSVKG